MLPSLFCWGGGTDIHVKCFFSCVLDKDYEHKWVIHIAAQNWVIFFLRLYIIMTKNIMTETAKSSSSPVCFPLGHTDNTARSHDWAWPVECGWNYVHHFGTCLKKQIPHAFPISRLHREVSKDAVEGKATWWKEPVSLSHPWRQAG